MSLSITHTHDDSSSHSRLPSLHVIPQVRALFVKMCLIKVEKVNSVSVQLERASMIRAVVKAKLQDIMGWIRSSLFLFYDML